MDQNIKTREQAEQELKDMGFQLRETHQPWYRRWKCRLLGPHDWVGVMRMLPSGALVEEGRICDVCYKETT